MSTPAHGNSTVPRLVVLGCGYLGTAVAEHALARGLEVTGVTRNPTTAALLRTQGVHAVCADLAGSEWHGAVPARPAFVLNCVAGGGAGVEGYRHSYLEGMRSLVQWTSRCGPAGTLVYTSSTSVYPQGGGAEVNEASPVAELNVEEGMSGSARLEAERRAILVETERCAMTVGSADRWFVLRLAGLYGPARHYLLDQVRSGRISGTGEHHLNVIHRDDAVAAIWACFEAPAGVRNQVFNVSDGQPARKRDVVARLAADLSLHPPEFTETPAAGRRAITPDRIISNRKLVETLRWAPRFQSYWEGCASLRPTRAN